jgi:hypothetical protein
MIRLIAIPLALGLMLGSANAQIPSVQGQQPGTLAPAYVPPVPPPPPPVAPRPVPSAVTPLPNPTYGIPPGVTAPTYSGITPTYRAPVYSAPKKKPAKKKRRPRVSSY